MSSRKFLHYYLFDMLTLVLPIIVACNLKVENPYVISAAIAVRALIGTIGSDKGNKGGQLVETKETLA